MYLESGYGVESTAIEKRSSLRELLAQADSVEHLLAEVSDAEFTELLERTAAEVAEHTQTKLDGYKFLIDALAARAPFWEARAKEAQRVQRSLLNFCERVKSALKETMRMRDLQQLTGREYRAQLTNAKASLVIDDAVLPDVWRMEVRETVVDRERIRAALEKGEQIPGARLEPGCALRFYPARPGDKTVMKEISNDPK